MAPIKRGHRLVRTQLTQQVISVAEALSTKCHFNTEECKALISMHEKLCILGGGKFGRLRFREFLHSCFDITDDVMLDLTFRGFDKNSDGSVDVTEFVFGLSAMLRGDLDELIDFCYFVYDMNGDRSLAREELFHCLKGCIIPGYGIDNNEIDDGEKEIVEITMKKLDVNHDGQITLEDFKDAVKADPLMLQAVGPCLPTPKSLATFLAIITENYRAYSGAWLSGGVNAQRKSSIIQNENSGQT